MDDLRDGEESGHSVEHGSQYVQAEYPNATEENMKAVQGAINAGMSCAELLDSFLEEVVWDCIVVLSGNENTPWALLDYMEGNEQTVIEDWQNIAPPI